MRATLVLLWFFVSCVQLLRGDDQLAVEDQTCFFRELKDMVKQLKYSQSQIDELKKQNAALKGRVDSTELTVEALRKESTNIPKVAFSFASGLNGYFGPLSVESTLIFRKQITNIGNAYNPLTGVFTAPLRGIYYFRFNVVGSSKSSRLAVSLMKNEERIFDVSKLPQGSNQYAVGGATLLLQPGDHVYVNLRSDSQITDDNNNHCAFSGFVLFAV
ncbi:complement C1q-like protein 3 [Pygocentrus nattereri]|uniref:C1q domain-containing protein n=1 Tax=Pygocentrus nattereri TaxID=42514 RepID=A0A3B4EJY8_PYGNA|nr:complement C1q-like protein 3 [Pygocentrus nattereri]